MVTVAETISVSESLGLRKKSGQKDNRGKPITEERIRVKGGTETKMTIDRSKRLKGLAITDVFHEVVKKREACSRTALGTQRQKE